MPTLRGQIQLVILLVSFGLGTFGTEDFSIRERSLPPDKGQQERNAVLSSYRATQIERRVAILLPILLLLLNLVRLLLLPLELLLGPLILLVTLLLRLLLRLLELLLIVILRPDLFLLQFVRLFELILEALRLLSDLLRIRLRKDHHEETTVITIDEGYRQHHSQRKHRKKSHLKHHHSPKIHRRHSKNHKISIKEFNQLRRKQGTTTAGAMMLKLDEISQKVNHLELQYEGLAKQSGPQLWLLHLPLVSQPTSLNGVRLEANRC